ncbi:peptidoglycan DD-metalloendopeptidase family protein [bacterium]|nr:peptidoglycan DD-metalloendopeptidase family protein [bacterium]
MDARHRSPASWTGPTMPHTPRPAPVFPFSLADARPLALAGVDLDVRDLAALIRFIAERRGPAPALYGGYGEDRSVYAASTLFDGAGEPRTIHLGLDVWTDAGTPLRAPLDAEVHSLAVNDRFGDYGGTIILTHDGFHTLWGHLAHRSLDGLREGQTVARGEQFAWLGEPDENGGWPPHLHLQRIEDLEGRRGDFPGVAPRSEKARWLANCPDPKSLLL